MQEQSERFRDGRLKDSVNGSRQSRKAEGKVPHQNRDGQLREKSRQRRKERQIARSETEMQA